MATVLFAVGLFNASCFAHRGAALHGLRGDRSAGMGIGRGAAARGAALQRCFHFPDHLLDPDGPCVSGAPGSADHLPNIVGGVLLPIILVLMLLLVNDRRLMGDYATSRIYNAIAWTTTVVIVLLSLTLLVTTFMPAGH